MLETVGQRGPARRGRAALGRALALAEPSWRRRGVPQRPAVYAGAATLAAVAVAVTVAIERTAGPTSFAIVLAAVAVAVWLGGLGPGLVATAITGLGMAVALLDPIGRVDIEDRSTAVRWLLFVVAALVITGLGHVMRAARDRAETSERHLALVSRAHEALEPSLEVAERLRRLTGVLAPDLCDWCAVRVEPEPEGAAGADGAAGAAASSAGAGPASRAAVAPARPTLLRTLDGDDLAMIAGLMGGAAAGSQPRSAILAPLEARGHRLGFIALITFEGRGPLGEDDLAVAAEIARRSALQIDNARLYEAARALSASLARSDSLKTAMLRGVSHEFRTPLTAIAAAAGALGHAEGAERDEMVAIVIEETDRLERLVANLLDLSRLEGGVLRPRLDECSPAELVAGARTAAGRFLRAGDVAVDIDPSAPLVRADPILTERVLVNLLQNATRHGAPPIRVSARPADGAMEIVVADAGPGVPPELRGSVFEPFTGSGAGGIGLGLALSQRLAEAEGGELALLDDGPGAAFCLRLPRADPPPPEQA
jgi:two-component system sensor histidine kinase KdpD